MFDWLKANSPSSRKDSGTSPSPVPAGEPAGRNDPARESAEHKSRGDLHYEANEFESAEECYRRAVSIDPGNSEAFKMLGNALNFRGRPIEAVACYQKAIELKPDSAGVHNNLGNVFHSLGRLADAVVCYQKTLALKPDFAAEVHSNLGGVFQEQGNLTDAVTHFREAIALKPEYADGHSNLGVALRDQGRPEAAVESYRRALSLQPAAADVHSNLLLTLHYSARYSPAEVFAEHRRFAERFEAPLKPRWPAQTNAREPNKRLKVGYVSADFRTHAVANFVEPILEHHDKSKVEVFCYYNHFFNDGVTERIKAAADHWLPCRGAPDEALAERIRADGIDILVDLGGHTAHNRLLVFARKPAPVQVTYLGYPATTGLEAIDYRLTDRYADPEGLTDRFNVERLWRLPECTWCYRAPEDSPAVIDHPPREDNGYVTFGCFNNFAKVTDPVLAAWARLLEEVPTSRLMLKIKGIDGASYRAEVEERFRAQGIPVERLVLVGQQKEHPFALYNRIDIALDPFPYNGTTTSFETLWMGVPFVTLAGQNGVSRVGVSILANAGLSELTADSADDYVNRAAAIALDAGRLKAVRSGLRERIGQSPLMDARGAAANLEQAYRAMWKTWCAS